MEEQMIQLPRSFGAAALRKRRAALLGRRSERRKGVSTGDPVQDLMNLASEFGYAGDEADLQGMADFVWQTAPTDGVGELLEELANMGLIRAPW
jgi:hypothetical protein